MKILLSLFCGLIFAASASAQLTTYPVGKIDRSFGDRGTLIPEVGAASYRTGNSVQLPDGKMVFVNTYNNAAFGHDVIGVTKLLASGLPDTSFGNGGFAFFSIGVYASAESIQNLPDGNLIIVGTTAAKQGFNYNDVLVLRLNADGSPDTSFGNNGILIKDFSEPGSPNAGIDSADAILEMPDGKLLIAGISARSAKAQDRKYVFLIRLNSDGSFDGTFGQNGILQTDVGENYGTSYGGVTLARYDKGRFLLSFSVETQTDQGIDQQGYISRYFDNGSVDKSFGIGGRFACTDGFPEVQRVCGNLKVLSGGNVMALMLGALIRVTPDGQLDPTFGNAGVRTFGTFINDYLIQDDQKILVTATDYDVPPPPQPGIHQVGRIMRIFSNGATDLRFGTLGRTRIDYNWSLVPGGDVFIGRIHRADEKHIFATGLYSNSMDHRGVIMLTKVTISK
jgi:uncharacterized delta-60 repeat protein